MIRVVESSLLGYAARGAEIARLADEIRRDTRGQHLVGHLVGLMVNQRVAEADLVAARIAAETGATLMHVIA